MKKLWMIVVMLAAAWVAMTPRPASAGVIEMSFGFSFNQSTYSEESYSWTRRWGANFGYQIMELTQLELGFQKVTDRTHLKNWEDTTMNDEIYSLNWVQNFTGKNAGIQPFVKAGVGQLNRRATGSYAFGSSPPAEVDSVIGILGFGTKIYLTKNLGLRGEVTSNLAGGSIRAWKDNIGVTLGFSFFF